MKEKILNIIKNKSFWAKSFALASAFLGGAITASDVISQFAIYCWSLI